MLSEEEKFSNRQHPLEIRYRLWLRICEICWPDTLRAKMKYHTKCKNESRTNQRRNVHPQLSIALSEKRLLRGTGPSVLSASAGQQTHRSDAIATEWFMVWVPV